MDRAALAALLALGAVALSLVSRSASAAAYPTSDAFPAPSGSGDFFDWWPEYDAPTYDAWPEYQPLAWEPAPYTPDAAPYDPGDWSYAYDWPEYQSSDSSPYVPGAWEPAPDDWSYDYGYDWPVLDYPDEPYTVGDVWPITEEQAMPDDQAAANLHAIKQAIAAAEGTDPNPYGWNPYGVTVGYEFEINDFSDHPANLGWAGNRRAGVQSNAAGKYQILKLSWGDFVAAVGPRDFSPASQEEFADWAILVKRKAGPEIAAGDLAGALAKLSWEWASLPPGRYGQPLRSFDWIVAQYESAGGATA